jgi:hypothetical protein
MPGFMLHAGAVVNCAHPPGHADPTVSSLRVKVGPLSIVTIPAPWKVVGCTLPPPPAANGPCVTALWTVPSTRVVSDGQPVLVQSSQALCAPSGTPLVVLATQQRVTAT